MSDIVQVVTTIGSSAAATQLAQQLVEEKLAACVQIDGPVLSVYRWQGKICEDQEWRCTIKTHASQVELLIARILELHSYEVPEVLVLPVNQASQSYSQWLNEQVGDDAT